ncbi:hypothetical protein VITU102760_08705 [Vibrio tubiashii]|uniref:Uncharacterized protein n=1 Tax=Vibrio tubiashii ATCC 19109 TaxID=1051646 RepID=A0ABN0D9I0_9VIBR|nr:hypothetical protein VITU9109_04812 [Vibrio tubiashii ATCC 19109]
MVVGILALSMISNGIYAKETTNSKRIINLELNG